MMGGGSKGKDLPHTSLVPESALSADARISDILVKLEATPEGGNLIGALQPAWIKAVESDMRLRWLGEMLRRELIVRDLQHFGGGINDKMRAESSKEGDLGREALMSLMKVKYQDERRYQRECVKVKEQMREWIRKKLSKGRFRTIVEKLKNKENKRRGELKQKYKEKTKHLESEREKEKIEIEI